MRPNNTEKIPESHYRDLSGDSSGSTIANNPQNANDQIACKFLRRQTIGRNTLYEGNVRSQEKSHPGDLNGAPRGQAERGLGDFSSENIAQEVQNVNEENDHTTTKKQAYRLNLLQKHFS